MILTGKVKEIDKYITNYQKILTSIKLKYNLQDDKSEKYNKLNRDLKERKSEIFNRNMKMIAQSFEYALF